MLWKSSMAAAAFAVVAHVALAEADLKPWKGKATPRLASQDIAGKPYDLESRRGRVIVVNFWATWCEPCRDEMPSLERLRARLGHRPFEVIAVNVGDSPERVQRFTREVAVSFPILFDRERETARTWQVRGYPTSYVVGPD